jgi:tetratricopeptide (TPR) repeat protein
MEEPPWQNRDDKNGSDETAAAVVAAAAAASTTGEIRFKDDDSFREDLTRLLYQPWPRSEEAIESSLSVIPWKILIVQETTSTTTDNHKKPSEATATIETASSSAKSATNTKPSLSLSSLAESKVSFPSISYLDLRRKQNLCFADDQCSKAQQNLDKGSPSTARAAWKQALELVPDHLPSLIGYGRFLLQSGKLQQSMELVNEALTIDPKHSLAQTLLSDLLETRHQTHQHRPYVANAMPHYDLLPNHQRNEKNNSNNKSKSNNPIALTTRKSSAYQDALLERQLLASPPRRDDSNPEGDLSLVYSDHGTDELSLSQSERNHRKKKDRRHRDHKDRRQKKRRRKEHRKRHNQKRHSRRCKYYSSDDDGSYDGSSSDEDSSSHFSTRTKDSSWSRRSAVSTRYSVPKQESSVKIPKKQEIDDETNHSEKSHETKRARENEDESNDDEGSSVSKRHRKRKRKKRRHDERSHKREPRTKKESSRKRRHHRKRYKRTKNDSDSSSSR